MEGEQWRNRICRAKSVSQTGFSLIELLVVLVIIVILVVIMNDPSRGSYQQKRMAMCEKNLQTIYTALNMYASDANNFFPIVTNASTAEQPLSLLVPRYTTVTEIFICPGTKDKPLPSGESFTNNTISYAYYMGWDKTASSQPLITDRQVDAYRKRQGSQMFSADGKGPGSNHNKYGGNVMNVDGAITAVKPRASSDLLFPTNVILLNPKP